MRTDHRTVGRAMTSTEQVIEQVARENIPDDAIYAAMDAMQNVVIEDDEGEFPRLFDLLDYSGENKARTVTHGLASAAVYAAAPHVIRAAIEALALPPKPVDGAPGVNCPDCGGRIASACPHCGAEPIEKRCR